MPHRDPAVRKRYEAMRYRKQRAARRAQIKAWKRAAYLANPEHTRAKWRAYRAAGRARAALREAEKIRAERPAKCGPGYTGRLAPTGF